ncbi:MAG: magnesium transporter [Nanoarchaeota archaeon]
MRIIKKRELSTVRKHLEKLRKVKKSKHSSLFYKIHHKYGISKKTLFYVKEYGPHANVAKTIIRESLKIVLLASILSSMGGLVLEHIKTVFLSIIPLIILMPTLNDMFGDYGIILSSKFATMLHRGEVHGKVWKNEKLRELFMQIFIIAMITTITSVIISFIISVNSGYKLDLMISYKIFLIAVLDAILLVILLILISVLGSMYFFKRKEDPNNLLVPITTSIADFGNMIILSILIIIFF